MSVLSITSSASIINWMSGNATATTGNRYIAMFSGDPLTTGVEQTFNLTGYVTRANATPSLPPTTTNTIANNIDIMIVPSCITACSFDHIALMSAATGGAVVASTPITLLSVMIGDSLKIPAGSLTISVS